MAINPQEKEYRSDSIGCIGVVHGVVTLTVGDGFRAFNRRRVRYEVEEPVTS